MQKNNDIKSNFSALLRDSLKNRFGRIPSAAVIAREFNLRAYNTDPISQESARRWIRGVSLPEEERLRVLVTWLDLDFNSVLRSNAIGSNLRIYNGQQYHHGNSSGNGSGYESGYESGNGGASLSGNHAQVAQKASQQQDHHEEWSIKTNGNGTTHLIDLFEQLDDHQKQLIIDLIEIGFKKEGKPHSF